MNDIPAAMNQEEAMKHMRGLLSFAETAISSSLTKDERAERSRRTLEKLQRLASTEMEKALSPLQQMPPEQRAEMTPKCASGCAYCCYQWVRATVQEVLAVADYVAENFSEQQKNALLEATRAYEAEFRSKDHSIMFALRCPLLGENNLCSVYSARPLICRGTASLDVEACRLGQEDPNSGIKVPFVGPLFLLAGALREGITAGTIRAGYPGHQVVLGIALRICLEDPQAGEKFFAGEDVFAAAAVPTEEPLRIVQER